MFTTRKKISIFWSVLVLTTTPSVFAEAIELKLPVKVFALKRGEPNPKIKSKLWYSDQVSEKAVLIASSFRNSAYRKKIDSLASQLIKNKIRVLWIDTRVGTRNSVTSGLEDIQTGVVFLRSDPRFKKKPVSKVSILAVSESVAGAAKYAGASKQIGAIVDKMILVDSEESHSSLIAACRPLCESVSFPQWTNF